MTIPKKLSNFVRVFLTFCLLSQTFLQMTTLVFASSSVTLSSEKSIYSVTETVTIEKKFTNESTSPLIYDTQSFQLLKEEIHTDEDLITYEFQPLATGTFLFHLENIDNFIPLEITIIDSEDTAEEPLPDTTAKISFSPNEELEKTAIHASEELIIYHLEPTSSDEYKIVLQSTKTNSEPDFIIEKDDDISEKITFNEEETYEDNVEIYLIDTATEEIISNTLYAEIASASIIQIGHEDQSHIGEIVEPDRIIKRINADIFVHSYNYAAVNFPGGTGRQIDTSWVKVTNASGIPVDEWIGNDGVYKISSYSYPITEWGSLLFQFNPAKPGTYHVYLEYEEAGTLKRSNTLIFEIISDSMLQALPLENIQANLGDFFEYNGVVDGYHSSNEADIEGPIAIAKDSIIPTVSKGFSYASSFLTPNTAVGLPIREEFDRQYIGVLIQGQIKNFSTPRENPTVENRKTSYAAPRNYRGWLVGTDETGTDMANWLPEAFGSTVSAIPYTISNEEMTKKFNYLRSVRDSYDDLLYSLQKGQPTTYYTGGGIAFGEKGYTPEALPIYYSNKSGVYLVDLDEANTTTGFLNSVSFPEDLILNSEVKQIVVYSKSANKVSFNGSTKIYKGSNGTGQIILPNVWDNIAVQTAVKVTYYFPNATQVTNYLTDNGSFPDTSSETGVDTNGIDQYSKNLETGNGDIRFNSSILGDVMAPQATVVCKSGNLSGSFYVKNLHQRDGMAINYFYTEWAAEETSPAELIIEKVDAEDHQLELEGARFVLYRKNGQGQNEFYTKVKNWTTAISESDLQDEQQSNLYFWTTNIHGRTEIRDFPLGTYYLLEVIAPEGYKLSSNQEQRTYAFTITEESQTLLIENERASPIELLDVTFEKIDEANGFGLENGQFQLANQDGEFLTENYEVANLPEQIKTYTSNEIGKIDFMNLKDGIYQIVETQPPEGYIQKNQPLLFNVENGQLSCNDLLTFVSENEIDFNTLLSQDALKLFTVTGEQMNTSLLTLTNQRTVAVNLDELLENTIYFVQYEKNALETLRAYFKLTNTNGQKKLTPVLAFENSLETGNLLVEKIDQHSRLPIKSVTFILYNEKNQRLDASYQPTEDDFFYQTDEQGQFYLTDIPNGVYYFKEYTAPEGYLFDKDKMYRFEVAEGKIILDEELYPEVVTTEKMIIYNTLQGILPDTGKVDSHWYLLLSLLLFLGGNLCWLFSFIYLRRRRNEPTHSKKRGFYNWWKTLWLERREKNMNMKKLRKIGFAFLSLLMVLPFVASVFPVVTQAQEDVVKITLHKLQFDEDPAAVLNPGTEIDDVTTVWPGAEPLAGAEFTVYDVTEAYHAAYKQAYEGSYPGTAATIGDVEGAKQAAAQYAGGNTAGTLPSYTTTFPQVASPRKITDIPNPVTTSTAGLAVFDGLPKMSNGQQAVYLFVETSTAADPIVTRLANNMIVALPVYDAENIELNNIHLYPKNTTSPTAIEITKEREKYDHKIGEDIDYTIEVTVPDNIEVIDAGTSLPAYNQLKIIDYYASELTFNSSSGYQLVVKKDDGTTRMTLTETTHYTFTETGVDSETGRNTWTIELTTAGLRALEDTDFSLVFTYKMYLNENAVPDTDYANKAQVITDFTTDETEDIFVITGGYEFIKKDSSNDIALSGAEFYVRNGTASNASYLKVSYSQENNQLISQVSWTTVKEEATVFVSDENGRIKLYGLDDGTYYMEEIKAPDGYILPNQPHTEFAVLAETGGTGTSTTKADDPEVITNVKKGFLPSTGSYGIYLFLIIGISMMAFVILWHIRSKARVRS